jgi:hypothetical protein
MLRHVALVRTYVSEELNTSFIGVIRIGELGTMLAVISNHNLHQMYIYAHQEMRVKRSLQWKFWKISASINIEEYWYTEHNLVKILL